MQSPPDCLDPSVHNWLKAKAVCAIQATIQKAGGKARIVGGAVRDALMERPVGDVDFACDLEPAAVIKALEQEGIKVVPTGIEHGTVTAVIDHRGYEITTLRRDMKTDGRHAEVVFTTDWSSDALRRDFTFNALYLDDEYRVIDYVGGLEDLKQRRIRFIGDPQARIREDVLRILRAFRFMACLEGSKIDPDSLVACCHLASSMRKLSAERVWHEIKRLLAAARPTETCRLMIEKGIFGVLLPAVRHVDRLELLLETEKSLTPEREFHAARVDPVARRALRRLAALWEGQPASKASQALRLSKAESALFADLVSGIFPAGSPLSSFALRQSLYEHGAETIQEAFFLYASQTRQVEPKLWQEVLEWKNPVFPLQGKDLISLGYKAGPALGEILGQIEHWWRMRDFVPSREECIKELEKYPR